MAQIVGTFWQCPGINTTLPDGPVAQELRKVGIPEQAEKACVEAFEQLCEEDKKRVARLDVSFPETSAGGNTRVPTVRISFRSEKEVGYSNTKVAGTPFDMGILRSTPACLTEEQVRKGIERFLHPPSFLRGLAAMFERFRQ